MQLRRKIDPFGHIDKAVLVSSGLSNLQTYLQSLLPGKGVLGSCGESILDGRKNRLEILGCSHECCGTENLEVFHQCGWSLCISDGSTDSQGYHLTALPFVGVCQR